MPGCCLLPAVKAKKGLPGKPISNEIWSYDRIPSLLNLSAQKGTKRGLELLPPVEKISDCRQKSLDLLPKCQGV